MRIAIAGVTGAVGRHINDVARERGHTVVALSRSTGVSLFDRAGVTGALDGVETVIDAASISTTSGRASVNFFGTTTTNLLAAGEQAGVGHHLALSIVNVDRAPAGYYAGKILQERLVAENRLTPWTILRTTQFHEFAAQMLDRAKIGPFRAIPVMRTQPIAAREVAVRLVDLAEGSAVGRAPDLAGPMTERLIEMTRLYADAAGLPGRIVPIPLPGVMGTAMRTGALLPSPDTATGIATFAEWLDAQYLRGRPSPPPRRV